MPRDPFQPYRIVVFLRDWEIEATEPMSEDVARAELDRIFPIIRVEKSPTKKVRIGPNVIVRIADIKRVKLVKLGDDDDVEGEIEDDY